MATYHQWILFQKQLADVPILHASEKKLYDALSEVNTMKAITPSVTYRSDGVRVSKITDLNSSYSSVAQPVPAVTQAPVVTQAAPVVAPEPAPVIAPAPTFDIELNTLFVHVTNNEKDLAIAQMTKMLGWDPRVLKEVSNPNPEHGGFVLANERGVELRYRTKKVEINPGLKQIQVNFSKKNQKMFDITPGVFKLMFMTRAQDINDFEWTTADMETLYKINRRIVLERTKTKIEKDPGNSPLSKIAAALPDDKRDQFFVYKSGRTLFNPTASVQKEVTPEELKNLESGIFVGASLSLRRGHSKSRDARLLVNPSQKTKNKPSKTKAKKRGDPERIQVLLGSIAAGNTSRKVMNELMSLL